MPHRRRLRHLVPVVPLLAACISGPKRELVTRPEPDPAGVAGLYCYRSPAANIREAAALAEQRYWRQQEVKQPGTIFRLQTGGFSGLPVNSFADSSLVEVTVDGDSLRLTYLDRATMRREARRYRIVGPVGGEVRLVDPKTGGGGVPLGIGTSSQWLTLTRGTDGRLTMIRWHRERALAFLVLPMQEYYIKTVDLDPAAACG
jgi:hypothetical protein